MNTNKSCPLCYGAGRIEIADCVDSVVRDHCSVMCPLCLGLGVRKAGYLWTDELSSPSHLPQ